MKIQVHYFCSKCETGKTEVIEISEKTPVCIERRCEHCNKIMEAIDAKAVKDLCLS